MYPSPGPSNDKSEAIPASTATPSPPPFIYYVGKKNFF